MWSYAEHSREVSRVGGVDEYKRTIALVNYRSGFEDGKKYMYPMVKVSYDKGMRKGKLEGALVGICIILGIHAMQLLIAEKQKKTKRLLQLPEVKTVESDVITKKDKEHRNKLQKRRGKQK